MSGHLANGCEAIWTSNKPRVRRVTIITSLKAVHRPMIVRIMQGLPGERGQYRVVPSCRLTPLKAD